MGIIAKWFFKTGFLLMFVGALLVGIRRMRWPGHLPGDITWKVGSSRVIIPLGTTALIGLVLTLYYSLSKHHR